MKSKTLLIKIATLIFITFLFSRCRTEDYKECQISEIKKLFEGDETQNSLDEYARYFDYYYVATYLENEKKKEIGEKDRQAMNLIDLNGLLDVQKSALTKLNNIKIYDDSVRYYKKGTVDYLNKEIEVYQWLIDKKIDGIKWKVEDYQFYKNQISKMRDLFQYHVKLYQYYKKKTLGSINFSVIKENCEYCERELTVAEEEELGNELLKSIREELIKKMGEKYRVLVEEEFKII